MKHSSSVIARTPRRVMRWFGVIGLSVILSACTFDMPFGEKDKASFISYPPAVQDSVEQGRPMEDFLPRDQTRTEQKKRLGLSEKESAALGCGLGDRFDRDSALAYYFSDDQSRLSLHMRIQGPSFSDPGRLEVNSLFLRFTHKLQKPAKHAKSDRDCLYPSQYQGLIGSTYNELFVRENYTIWRELDDRGLGF